LRPDRQPVPPATAVHRWSAAGPAPRRRLVLFPHAGGGGLTGRSLQLPGTEILVHRRPGRESRMAETATVTAQDAVAEALAVLLPVLDADEIPTTVLGHSFGALIAAGFAAAVDRLRPGRLECVVLSAKAAPPAPDPELAAILEDDDALAAWVLALGGTPRSCWPIPVCARWSSRRCAATCAPRSPTTPHPRASPRPCCSCTPARIPGPRRSP
ncbi:thioesterase domain-containing protein, partial [Kocuria varians]|uniref:thioesterase domain-containing protein n=1 Tax=Kocuria varians TaxID=1272 RepID=UPI000B2B73BE